MSETPSSPEPVEPAQPPETAVPPVEPAPVVDPGPPPGRLRQQLGRLQHWREAHPFAEAAGFFVAGLIYDVATLDRIDSPLTMAQHALWLVLLAVMLVWPERYVSGDIPPPRRLGKVLPFSESIIHFLFGGLLSSFALFYSKSASGLAGLLFCVVMFGLLVANELPQLRRLGRLIRFGLLSFCLTSYLAYVLPILFGFLSVWLFLLSVALSFGIVFGVYRLLVKMRGNDLHAVRTTLLPALLVQALLVGLYTQQVVPPVPVSVQYMGIYHGIEKDGGNYRLLHQRPDWRFWHHGDQRFLSREGDVVHAFAAIFAPRGFKDQVNLRWMWWDEKQGWRTSDVIPLTVQGGRDKGFRGHARKAHHKPGEWRVQVETDDGRAIGHIDFTIEKDDGSDGRDWKVEVR